MSSTQEILPPLSNEPQEPVSSTATPEPTIAPEPEMPSTENAVLFQAIGTFHTKPQQDQTGKFFVSVGGQRYGLFIPRFRFKLWLKQLSNHPDTSLFLRVYPKCLIIPRKDPLIRFELAAWGEENQWDESPGLFKFRGIWQFVPQLRSEPTGGNLHLESRPLRTPVISIYRNRNANDPSGKFKASHLPVLMRREDGVNPFKFNPRRTKEQLPERWFIQALFKFIPNRNCWGWVEDLAPPTQKFPKYTKPVKALPTEQKSSLMLFCVFNDNALCMKREFSLL